MVAGSNEAGKRAFEDLFKRGEQAESDEARGEGAAEPIAEGEHSDEALNTVRCDWCNKPVSTDEAVWADGQARHSGTCQEQYESALREQAKLDVEDGRVWDLDQGSEDHVNKGSEQQAQVPVETTTATEEESTVETATVKRRGKPNPRELQILQTIANFEAGTEEPIPFEYDSEEKAKKSYTNLYTAFKNRGFKVSITQAGTQLLARITGKAGARKAAGKKSATRKKPGRPKGTGRGPGRPRKTAVKQATGNGTSVLVRVRAGRGWTYQEFDAKDKAEAALYALDSSGSAYEVYERKAVQVKKTVEGW